MDTSAEQVVAGARPNDHPGEFGPVVETGVSTILELIDRRIADAPRVPAVVEGDRTVTYEELDRLADLSAAALRHEFSVGSGDTVLVAGAAGVDFTAVVLGVLRVGAAYLPVDMTYPKERIEQILELSDATLTVCTSDLPGLLGRKRATTAERVLALGEGHAVPERYEISPDDPAYLIFTSGSTGVPKGIIQTHRCLANFISWQVGASGLGEGRRILQNAPVTFDVSVQEVFHALASGSCLYVPGTEVRQDPRDLVQFIIDRGIEVVDFPQSLLDMVMSLPVNLGHAPALRHIISAGETVRVTPALEELLERRPELTMHNHYGPAENHMVASHSMSSAGRDIEPAPPVGSLVWNTYVLVLDEDRRPVPTGEVGEVYIGGVGVAIGYTDPELSRAAFVPDPFWPGARLYRTRDRGSWNKENETLRLLGRMDDLIKIRGNVVEPREVERHLVRCPGVREAAAFGVAKASGTTELHALLIGEPASAQELRRELLTVLPDYMVPVRWYVADAFPTSPNGKLDRASLPGPGARPLPVVVHHSKDSR